jgi:hypothetical protein
MAVRNRQSAIASVLARKHGLAIDQWRMVGDMDSDAGFARAIGARYHDAREYFRS